MVNALFDLEETESERTVIISERHGLENSPLFWLEEEVIGTAFRVHGYHHDIIGDLAKQQAHAEAVLVPLKVELGAAADEMERAVRAAQPAQVLEGVSHREGGNSYVIGLEAALRYCQTPADYDTIACPAPSHAAPPNEGVPR